MKTLLRCNDLEWTQGSSKAGKGNKERVFRNEASYICKLTDKRLNVDAHFIAFNTSKRNEKD